VILETLVKQAQISKQITTNYTQGTADAIVLKANASAGTFMNVTQSQAQAYSQLKTNLGLTNQELIQYLQLSMIQSTNGNIVISLKNAQPATPPAA